MKKVLFLDDNEERHKRFCMNRIGVNIAQARTYSEACTYLAAEVYDVAYLDHDLSELAAVGQPAAGEKTGTDVANFIASLPKARRPRFVVVHSFNTSGRERMLAILRDAEVPCVGDPFRG